MNQYAFKRAASARYTGGATADVIGAELHRIWAAHGQQLVPADVVEEARPKRAALHRCFEWDDAIAGQNYRVIQARHLIRSVTVETPQGVLPAFINVKVSKPVVGADGQETEEESRYYQETKVVASRPAEYFSALAAAQARLIEAQEAFAVLKSLASKQGRSNADLRKLAAIAEALTTAKTIAGKLQ